MKLLSMASYMFTCIGSCIESCFDCMSFFLNWLILAGYCILFLMLSGLMLLLLSGLMLLILSGLMLLMLSGIPVISYLNYLYVNIH